MGSTTFARARSDDQRAVRRTEILGTAKKMLDEGTRVADLSLNELARRVGLAKSNVLRYFETREAVLLELLGVEYDHWLDDVADHLSARGEPSPVDRVADAIATAAADRPVLAELLASSTGVLEHNVSPQVAADYKRRSIAQARRLVELIEREVGPLDDRERLVAAGAVVLVVGGAWSLCRPSPGMTAAYAIDPELASFRLDYRPAVRELVATVLAGLRARPVGPLDRG